MEVAVSPLWLACGSSDPEPEPDLVLVLGLLPVILGLSGGGCLEALGRWCNSSPPEVINSNKFGEWNGTI